MKTLSPEQAKQFYDDFGPKQDDQSWYEEPAVEQLIANMELGTASHVLEFGCGTGKLAQQLLREYLPEEACYTGIDISDTMISLARERGRDYSDRATFIQLNGCQTLPFSDEAFDRVITTYVLDILAERDIRHFFAETRRLLVPGGILGTVSITKGINLLSKLVMGGWNLVHRISPAKVGGCRPLVLSRYFQSDIWKELYHAAVSVRGIASEISVWQKNPQ